MKILIVIPMYGKEEYTRKCIEFTAKNAGIDCDILVVDDGSETSFTYYGESVNIIRLEKNSGFTAAVNAGILWAQVRNYNYVMLLNNDTEPYDGFLKYLLHSMQSNVGITGSIRFHPDKSLKKAQTDSNELLRKYKIELCGSDLIRGYQYYAEKDIPSKPFDCNIIPFASVLLSMNMIREIGLLDKKYKNHCSDTEYCIRAKMNKWRVVLVPDSKVLHHLSVTTTANNILVDDDQKKWIETLAGLPYAEVMASMPLDGEAKTWGRLSFEVYQK